ncbi:MULTISPECIES: glycosyltransferase family 2 protein [unclassified Pseudoclavibacter]|uniref:glycosyltransferase family 2 protein n=1 Tax=unclassified Pseudoclavibacter TaxID=2615177 RepID=UPI001BAC998B|nr:glycosyltransferase family 2 protein [Pseudoclavibacter sp. Marseille-Q4354]MBS3180149.1 glycosyltransferase family 2 protein [Pseudoclavibacter sp. Marseille-Q4354]
MQANDPRLGISVVVPHYGDRSPTAALVDSLRAQDDCPPLQIIVVDDCSPTPLEAIVGATVVRREKNGGYGSAINSGVLLADHETILILNSDLEIPKSFVRDLAAQCAPLMPAVVSPQIVDEHGNSQWPARHFPTVGHHFVAALSALARYRHSNRWHEAVGHDTRAVTGNTLEVDWVVGAVMLLPTSAFRSVHGFDEGFYMNSEEVDLQRRLRNRNIPSVFLGTVQATHESGGSSDPSRRRAWMLSSALRYAQKWKQSPLLLRVALAAAALINFSVNALRQIGGRKVDALGTLHQELRYSVLPTQHRS